MLLESGSTGPEVARMQRRLIELGYRIDRVDGVFGSTTEEALQMFKHRNGLDHTATLTDDDSEVLFSEGARPAGATVEASDPVGAHEMRAMLELLFPAMQTDDEEARRALLTQALMTFGVRALSTLGFIQTEASADFEASAEATTNLALEIFIRWLGGDALTEQADEDELRALAALDALDVGGSELVRLAAGAVLKLPAGHPLRDLAVLREKLLARLSECREQAQWQDFGMVAATLLDDELLNVAEALPLAEELLAVADSTPEAGEPLEDADRRRFYVSVAGWHFTQAVAIREQGGDPAAAASHREAFTRVMAKATAIQRAPRDVLLEALALDEAGEDVDAAALLAPLADGGEEGSDTAAWIEGMIRLRLGHYERAVEVLERVVPGEQARYVLATGDQNIQSAGERHGKDAANLAFGYALLGRWANALDALDRAKSARMRHAAALRQTPEGKALLELEARLASANRGVPNPDAVTNDRETDPLGSRLSNAARALEQYRSVRPDLGTAHLAPPTVAQVGALLEEGEALVCLGSTFKGLMIAVILSRDEAEPTGRFILEELPGDRLVDLMFTGKEVSGWALELAALEPVNPEPALESFMAKADDAFGRRLAEFLVARRVHTATIVPHRVLHLVPFWALPSLRQLDVRTARSMASWYEARRRTVSLSSRACVVGNPTLDLPLATAEAESVRALLAGRGCRADLLTESAAREAPIRKSVRESGILHFAGHGIARPLQPLHSALLTHPDERWGWPAAGDPLARFAARAVRWLDAPDGTRYADLPEGRLVEYTDEEGGVVERRLEHAGTGTLWGRYHDNELLELSELWTAGDILTEDAFASCSVAFLVACQSGQPPFQTDVDEDLSLPGALQLAGVSSVVCTLWPVTDLTALVFSCVFYRKLVAAPRGPLDLCRLVADCRAALAAMRRDDAVALLHETVAHTTGRATRAHLEFEIDALAAGPALPFEHPYHWAAFFTQGVGVVEVPWE